MEEEINTSSKKIENNNNNTNINTNTNNNTNNNNNNNLIKKSMKKMFL